MLTNHTQLLINVSVWYDTSQLVLQVGTLRNELPNTGFHVVTGDCHYYRSLTMLTLSIYTHSHPHT